jgi:hypothetical protein
MEKDVLGTIAISFDGGYCVFYRSLVGYYADYIF